MGTRREILVSDFSFFRSVDPEWVDAIEQADKQEEQDTVVRALMLLTPTQAKYVTARFYDRMTIAEIAELHEVSTTAVESTLRRGLVALERQLETEETMGRFITPDEHNAERPALETARRQWMDWHLDMAASGAGRTWRAVDWSEQWHTTGEKKYTRDLVNNTRKAFIERARERNLPMKISQNQGCIYMTGQAVAPAPKAPEGPEPTDRRPTHRTDR